MTEPQVSKPSVTLDSLLEAIGRSDVPDQLVGIVDRVGAAIPRSWRPLLEGGPLGHPVHPLLTDLPIGFWTSANTLDLIGGRRSAAAARRLTGLGVLSAVPTLLSGLADYGSLTSQHTRRIAAVHAAGNTAATALYSWSWIARRNHRATGIVAGLIGAGVATGAGMLGGHLAFGTDEDPVAAHD